MSSISHLILRSARSACLEGWATAGCLRDFSCDGQRSRCPRLYASLRRRQLLRRFGPLRAGSTALRARQRYLWRLHVKAPAGRARLVRALPRYYRCHCSRTADQRVVSKQEGGIDSWRLRTASGIGKEEWLARPLVAHPSRRALRALLRMRFLLYEATNMSIAPL